MTEVNESVQTEELSPAFHSDEAVTSEESAMAGLESLAAEMLGETLSEDPARETEEPEQVEEDVEVESSTDEEVEAVDEDSEETEVDADRDIVAYDDFKDLALEIGGKHYSGAQLKSMIGQVNAASKTQNEVKTQIEAFEAREAAIAERETSVSTKQSLTNADFELASRANNIRGIEQELEKARANDDLFDKINLKDQYDQAVAEYHNLGRQVEAEKSKQHQGNLATQAKVLEAAGYGSILGDDNRKALIGNYLVANADSAIHDTITSDATLLIMVEKARQWDAAQSGAKKGKLKTSGKTLKSGSGGITSSKSKTSQATRTQMAAGQGSEAEAIAGIDAIAAGLFGN